MRRNIRRLGASGIAIVSMLHVETATAALCAGQIAEFRGSLPHDRNGELTFVSTARQSIAAQLGHQPTRESVERAKKESQAQILAILEQAEALDLDGKRKECFDAFARAKLMLDPSGGR
jgi:hypothetical protein